MLTGLIKSNSGFALIAVLILGHQLSFSQGAGALIRVPSFVFDHSRISNFKFLQEEEIPLIAAGNYCMLGGHRGWRD